MSAARVTPGQVTSIVDPTPPGWVSALLDGGAYDWHGFDSGYEAIQLCEAVGCALRHEGASGAQHGAEPVALLRGRVEHAGSLDDDAFRRATQQVYLALLARLRERELQAVRLWSYVPDIGRPARGHTRYEIFNEGRFDAYRSWYRNESFEARLGSASAVGHRGSHLVVHVLAADQCGTPLENPRQRPAYTYSQRYGPRPPSFARALRLERPLVGAHDGALTLVSGTASIVGEASQHPGDIAAQLDEVCRNLAALVGCSATAPAREVARALSRYRELRVYLVRERDAEGVKRALEARFGGLERLELVAADLCRTDLLVEIEGILDADERNDGSRAHARPPALHEEPEPRPPS